MYLLRVSAVGGALLFASPQAHADVVIGCGGYDPKINDHVEWEVKINGPTADFDGEQFKVSETKNFFILIGPHSQIRINKKKKSYVILGLKGKRAPALEWSRRVPGEGCEISK